jgi:hypothetical protein
MEFTFHLSIEPKIKIVIALAVFIQLQESMTAKVIYLNEENKKK